MKKTTITIPGEHAGSRLVVLVGRGRKLLQRTPYNLFLELVAARFSHGYLYTSDIEMSLGNAPYTRRLFLLLREQLGISAQKGFIQRHDGCAFLDVEPSQIVIAPAALDMPPDVLDPGS